jgi:hypothetical protein
MLVICQEEKRGLRSRAGERASRFQDLLLRTSASRQLVPASSRTGHPFAVSSSAELSPKIECVFSASLETRWLRL